MNGALYDPSLRKLNAFTTLILRSAASTSVRLGLEPWFLLKAAGCPVYTFSNQERDLKLQPGRVQGSRPRDGSFQRSGQRDERPCHRLDRRQVQDLERGPVHHDRGQAAGSGNRGSRRYRRGEES